MSELRRGKEDIGYRLTNLCKSVTIPPTRAIGEPGRNSPDFNSSTLPIKPILRDKGTSSGDSPARRVQGFGNERAIGPVTV